MCSVLRRCTDGKSEAQTDLNANWNYQYTFNVVSNMGYFTKHGINGHKGDFT